MSESDAERQLREALAARAESAVGDFRPVPAPRFLTEPAPARRRVQWLAPVAAAVAVLGLVGGVLAVAGSGGSSTGPKVVGGHSASTIGRGSDGPSTPAASATSAAPAAKTVHIKLYNGDNATYGVAMPVVAIFSHRISNARPFVQATKVTVNKKPIKAAWYFEQSVAGLGAMEAHLRPQHYWPAHAQVHVALDTRGRAAGKGFTYDDSLTLDFRTGARTIVTVDDKTNYLSVTSDAKTIVPSMPVSLGSAKTPTSSGTKVIMAKDASVELKGPGYDEVVSNALRLTYSGEYIVGVPADVNSVKRRIDRSNGCTDLLAGDAEQLYGLLQVGDPVEYQRSGTPTVPAWDGFGDWNVPWKIWLQGGLLPTS